MKRLIGFPLAMAAVGIMLTTPIGALAAGLYSTLPVVGAPAFPGGSTTGYTGLTTQTGTGPGTGGPINSTTVPAGPPYLTGAELIPADTGLLNGAPPATVTIPVSLLGTSVNRLIGGDATTNLNQRSATTKGIALLAGLSPTAAVITADRWWAIAPAAGLTYTVDSTVSSATVPVLNNTKAFRLARTSSGAAGVACWGQTLDSVAAAPLIGNNAVFSFYEKNGSTMSATNGNIVVNIDYSTVADITTGAQSAIGLAGTNGKLFALLDVGGTTTGLTNGTQAVTGFSPGTTGTLTAGLTNGFSATIAASTTWTRYSVFATIPATVTSSSTPVTEVSVSVCWTPIATTAVTTDYIELEGMQLEAKPATVTANLPNGVISPSAFQRRDAAVEQALQYYYWYYNFEQQSLGLTLNGMCENTASTVANCNVIFPEPMRLVPGLQFTAGFQVFAQVGETSISVCSSNSLSTTLASFASNTGFLMNCTASVGAAGTANQWMSIGTSAGAGVISASAEP